MGSFFFLNVIKANFFKFIGSNYHKKYICAKFEIIGHTIFVLRHNNNTSRNIQLNLLEDQIQFLKKRSEITEYLDI